MNITSRFTGLTELPDDTLSQIAMAETASQVAEDMSDWLENQNENDADVVRGMAQAVAACHRLATSQWEVVALLLARNAHRDNIAKIPA